MKTLILMAAGLCSLLLAELVTAGEAHEGYLINPGDTLQISVWKEEGLQLEVSVRPDGRVSFPLVGSIDTTGLTVEAFEAVVTEKLSDYIPDPVVTVSTGLLLGNKIYVLGEVNRPGEFPINSNIDVMQALAKAGGMSPFASENKIKVLRRSAGKQVAIPFSYDAVESAKDLSQNIVLQSGDIVVVP